MEVIEYYEEGPPDAIEELTVSVQNNPTRMNNCLDNNDIIKLAKAFESSRVISWLVFAQRHLELDIGDVENIKEDYQRRSEKVWAQFNASCSLLLYCKRVPKAPAPLSIQPPKRQKIAVHWIFCIKRFD